MKLLNELLDLVEYDTPGLDLGTFKYDDAKKEIHATIGGKKYIFTPHVADKAAQLYASVTGMAKHSTGRALAYLKKNASGRKLTESVDILTENKYYEVTAPMTVYAKAGMKASNEYYGSSRVHRAVWEPMKLDVGDEIHWLVGGLFAVKDGKGHFIMLTKPADKSAFEKSYGDPHQQRTQEIKKLVSDGSIDSITREEATKAKYLTD